MKNIKIKKIVNIKAKLTLSLILLPLSIGFTLADLTDAQTKPSKELVNSRGGTADFTNPKEPKTPIAPKRNKKKAKDELNIVGPSTEDTYYYPKGSKTSKDESTTSSVVLSTPMSSNAKNRSNIDVSDQYDQTFTTEVLNGIQNRICTEEMKSKSLNSPSCKNVQKDVNRIFNLVAHGINTCIVNPLTDHVIVPCVLRYIERKLPKQYRS